MFDNDHVFVFTSKSDSLKRVEFHLRGDANLSEMLEAFTQYLKAVGYHVDTNATLDFCYDFQEEACESHTD